MDEVWDVVNNNDIDILEIWIELGCFFVGEVGIIFYKVGLCKEVLGIWNYIVVDGGMFDNICLVLYDVYYDVVFVVNLEKVVEEIVVIVGKCCEFGDMLIWDLLLLKLNVGEVLVVFCIGVYGYVMVSNYNCILRLLVVFVENGVDKLIVVCEIYENLV